MDFEDIHFKKGRRISMEIGTQLQIEIDGVDYSFKSTLIGIEPEKYLITSAPITSPYGNIKHKYFRGNKIIVRYLFKGSVFGFQSELIEDIYTPLKLLFIKYPDIIEERNLRSLERIPCFLPLKIRIKGEEIDAVILDLNRGGCCCVFKKTAKNKELQTVQMDEELILRCSFPQAHHEVEILGKTKSVRREKKQVTLGLIFHDLEPEIEDTIDQYILTIKELPGSE